MENNKNRFMDELNKAKIELNDGLEFIKSQTKNSLCVDNRVLSFVYPKNVDEVLKIVDLANKFKISLYPISCGMNLGYGSKMPNLNDEIVVDMKYFNKIYDFSKEDGTIRIESGVTQEQLFNYLQDNNLPYFMDVTGSGKSASILGNILEGGFGHTPKGYKRENFEDVEVVLGNGDLFRSGIFPNLGPDLSKIFVQSNFGIVISAQVNLNLKPERFEAFSVQIDREEDLFYLIENISILKQDGTINSLVHVANSLRSFMTTRKCPDEFLNKVMSIDDARIMQDYKFMKAGAYLAIGGLYGTADEVRLKKRKLKKIFNKVGSIKFFNDDKMKLYSKLCSLSLVNAVPNGKYLKKMYESFVPSYGLMKGVPTDEVYNNIAWKVKDLDDLGMIWCSPTIRANREDVDALIKLLRKRFDEYSFECPLTLTFVKPGRLISILNINFDKRNSEEQERAFRLYEVLEKEFKELGVDYYRKPITSMQDIEYDVSKIKVLKSLKKVFDPNNVIAPNRYGI